MKKIIIGLVAASVVAAPAAAAPSFGNNNDRGRHEQVQRYDNRSQVVKMSKARQVAKQKWQKGQRFDSRNARNYAVVYNPRAYGQSVAPQGYHWVRSDNDLILVSIASGIIGAVIASAF